MPLSKEILNSHSVTALKKEIAKTNIKGYSKMKKAEVISLMMKPEHSTRFGHIKPHVKEKVIKEKVIKKKVVKEKVIKKKVNKDIKLKPITAEDISELGKGKKPKAKLGESGIGKKRKRITKPIKKKTINVEVPEPKKKVIPTITITEAEKPKKKVYKKGGKFFKPKEVKSKLPPIPKSNVKIRLPKETKQKERKVEHKKGFIPNTKEQKKELEEVEKIVKDNKNNFIISKDYNRVSSLIDKLKLYSNNKLNTTKFQYKFNRYRRYKEKVKYLTGKKEINEVEIDYEIYNKDLSLNKTITTLFKDKTGELYKIKEPYPHSTIFKLNIENEKEEPKKEEPKKEEPKKEKKSSELKTLSQIPSNLKKVWKEFVMERVGSFLEKYQLEELEGLVDTEKRFKDLEIKKKDKNLRAKEKFNILNDIGEIIENTKEDMEDEPRFDKIYKILSPKIYLRIKEDLKQKKKEKKQDEKDKANA